MRIDAVPPGLVGDEVELVEGGYRRVGHWVRVAFTTTEPVSTWELDVGRYGRPGHHMRTSLNALDAPFGSRWEAVQATIVAGAVGYPAGEAATGIHLLAWEEGRWRTVASGDAGLDEGGGPQPGTVRWGSDDPDRVERMVFEPDRSLHLAVVPTAPNGTGYARLATDYAEVRIRYRLPPEREGVEGEGEGECGPADEGEGETDCAPADEGEGEGEGEGGEDEGEGEEGEGEGEEGEGEGEEGEGEGGEACDPGIETTCIDGTCLWLGWVCDGEEHCPDDSDELDCD